MSTDPYTPEERDGRVDDQEKSDPPVRECLVLICEDCLMGRGQECHNPCCFFCRADVSPLGHPCATLVIEDAEFDATRYALLGRKP